MSILPLWLLGTVLTLDAAPPAGSPEALAATLRQHLVRAVPPVLYEARPGWGTQKRTFRGVKWRPGLRPEIQRGDKNDGTWRHIRISAGNLQDTLQLHFRDLRHLEEGRTTFGVNLAFDARLDFTQQHWKIGFKLYDGSVRARFRVHLALDCELTSRVETGKVLPEAVVRVRVTRADLRYDNLVVEHVAGVGGELAQLLGKAVHDGLRQWRPSLERDLLAKANAALVKAGDTGEVRVGLRTLLNPRNPLALRPRDK